MRLFVLLLIGFLFACTPKPVTVATPVSTPEMSTEMPPPVSVAAKTPTSPRIERLLAQMTTKEKIGQMTQLNLDMVLVGEPYAPVSPARIDMAKLRKVVQEYGVGSMLNTPTNQLISTTKWRGLIDTIAAETAKTRLKIPVLIGIDAIHGVNYAEGSTLFPQPLGIAATWNRDLATRTAQVTAYEGRAAGLPWNFSPAMDVGRNPTWARTWESFGEDVYMNIEMGKAVIEGYQGADNDLNDPYHMAACLKHFTGYGAGVSGKDRTPAWVPERYLKEYFLPQYRANVAQGAITAMVNSGEINGIPTHTDRRLLTEVLKNEFGLQGILVTDWNDIPYLNERHRVSPNFKESVRQSILAGIDMSMTPVTFQFADDLLALVEAGAVPMSRIDEAVRRILYTKERLGLFEQMTFPANLYGKFGGPEHAAISKEAALESWILLKNQDVLPLNRPTKVLVTGPAATSLQPLNGGWTYTWQGEFSDKYGAQYNTILEAFQRERSMRVNHVPGGNFVLGKESADRTSAERMRAEAVRAAASADVIVLCVGEASYTEDSGNINDLNISRTQRDLAEALLATGKPVVLVAAQGRPRILGDLAERAAAVVVGFYPGMEGGNALVDLLYGDANFSGRLPLTYPGGSNELVAYDHKYTEDRDVWRSGKSFTPMGEFGTGMSYTTFAYANGRVSQAVAAKDATVTVSVDVTNTGKRAGKAVVQLYSSDLVASITPSVRRLRNFEKVALAPGETKTVSLELPVERLAFVGRDNEWVVEPGDFKLTIGTEVVDFRVE